jgi:hypothetical protein
MQGVLLLGKVSCFFKPSEPLIDRADCSVISAIQAFSNHHPIQSSIKYAKIAIAVLPFA